MEKLLREIIDEEDRKKWGDPSAPAEKKKSSEEFTERRVGIQRLQLIRDGSIRYDVPKAPVEGPDSALQIFRTFFAGADREIVATLALNAQNQFIAITAVAVGTLTHVEIHPREVFKAVLAKDNAAGFIIAHNHPSGNPTPSPEDLDCLAELRDLGGRLGCQLLDFIIIGDGSEKYYSHREIHY